MSNHSESALRLSSKATNWSRLGMRVAAWHYYGRAVQDMESYFIIIFDSALFARVLHPAIWKSAIRIELPCSFYI